MSKFAADLEWNFAQASGNAVIVENATGPNAVLAETATREHSSTISHERDVMYAVPDENSSKNDAKGDPEEDADHAAQDHAALLKKSGAEKFDNGDYGGALADFDAAYIIEPKCPSTLKYRAEIKRILCQFDEAMADLNRADKLQPNNLFTLSTRGTVYRELQNYEHALQDLNRANEIDSKNAFIKTQLGVVKRSLRQFEEALVDLNEANTLKPNQAFVLAQLGTVKRELSKFSEALKDLDTAHGLDPNDGFVCQQRGVVRRELGDLEGALHDFNRANTLIPKDAYTLRRRAVVRRELLDYRGSLEDLDMANTLETYNDFTLSERGVTKKVLGDFKGAFQDLTMANHIKPHQAFTLKHRGSVNRELGNIDGAIHDLSCADKLEPNDFFTLWELAMTKKLSGDNVGSLVHYDKVVEMEPNHPSILRQRGSVKRMLGDFKGALDDFNKVDESQTVLYNKDLETMKERCFTKYAMNDVAGAVEDAKIVRSMWGVNGQSSIKGERLKQSTTHTAPGPSESASSMSQKLCDVEKSTACHHILWIDHSKLLFSKHLGTGSYGLVHKCKWVDRNIDVAVKYVTSQIKDAFEYEVRMLANIRHPRVVRFIGCSYDEEIKQGLIVMELMQQNLRSLIDSKKRESGPPFDVAVAVNLMYQIAEGMACLHDQGVLHRDLKSSNVLVNKGVDGKGEYVVKIADFGMAKLQGKNSMPCFMTADVGATMWRAPEVFREELDCHKYSFPADVWSYAMTCYEILTGNAPFEDVACSQVRHKVLCGLRPELPESCPGVLKVLLTKCWSLMPYERPTFAHIQKTLKLFTGRDSDRDMRGGDVVGAHELRSLNIALNSACGEV